MITIPRSKLPSTSFAVHPNEFLNTEESQLVASLVLSVFPYVVIEFGVNLGKTARIILDASPTIQRYIGIDVQPDHAPRLDCQRYEIPLRAGEYALNDPRFELLYSESTTLRPDDLPAADAVFIDGDHSAIAVEHDSRLALEILNKGGIIVWHDYGNLAVEVTEALDQLVAEGWPIRHIEKTWLAFLSC